jgi:hypothetical protein
VTDEEDGGRARNRTISNVLIADRAPVQRLFTDWRPTGWVEFIVLPAACSALEWPDDL